MAGQRGLFAVAGHARSGTTLLVDLCNSHPELAVTNELGVFTSMNRPFREWVRSLNLARVRHDGSYTSRTGGTLPGNLWFLARVVGATGFAAHGSRVRVPAVERGLRAALPRARFVGDKRPSYVFGLRRFYRGGIPVVVIYRDGRDVLASLRTTGARGVGWAERMSRLPLGAQATRWVRAIEAMESAPWAHCMRYEALLATPDACLSALAAYLGVAREGFDTSVILTDNAGKWRSIFTADEVAAIEAVAGPTLRRLGYA